MFEQPFHFNQIFWFWGLTLIPIVVLWRIFTGSSLRQGQEKVYADQDLLPFLTGVSHQERGIPWRKILLWIVAWICLLIAMAEPRWKAKQVGIYQANADLIILLDISRSMNGIDIKPSRLRRAKQEIEDLLNLNQEFKTGLIAFATAAVIIAPMTLDKQSLLKPLPTLSSDLVNLKGSRLSSALTKASELLQGQPNTNQHHLILLTDGDFNEPDLVSKVKALRQKSIFLHVLGMGTTSGSAVLIQGKKPFLDKNGAILKSRLNTLALKKLAQAGGGRYLTADYSNTDSITLLKHIQKQTKQQQKDSKTLVWQAYYQWFILMAFLILILMYRSFINENS